MKKPVLFIVILLAIAVVGWAFRPSLPGPIPQAHDYKNISYTINGQLVTLVDGKAETEAAPGSASKTTTQYFGNEATGDLNSDGIPDIAFLLAQNTGGTGNFYYVVAALKDAAGNYTGTNAVLLGDRIAPQTTEYKNGTVVVNYADRKPGEPMTAQPSVGVSRTFAVKNTTLAEVPSTVGIGARCGGNMTTAPVCSAGLHCAPAPGSHLPFGDVGGVCVANTQQSQ